MLRELLTHEVMCLDIRSQYLRFILSTNSRHDDSVTVKKFGTVRFDDEILSPTNLDEKIDIIKNLFLKEEIKTKLIKINISTPSMIVRIVKIQFMKDQDLAEHIRTDLSQYIPVDETSFTVDYKVLDYFEENNQKMMNVMLTAVPNSAIDICTKIFRGAGLNPLIIDLYPNTISKLFVHNKNEAIAVVDLNRDCFDFEIIKNGRLFMYSSINLESHLDEVTEATDFFQTFGNSENFSSIIEQIIGYINTYLKFYSSRHHGNGVNCVRIIGELSLFKKVEEFFETELHLPIHTGFNGLDGLHFEDLDKNSKETRKKFLNRLSIYSCALGLSMRGDIF